LLRGSLTKEVSKQKKSLRKKKKRGAKRQREGWLFNQVRQKRKQKEERGNIARAEREPTRETRGWVERKIGQEFRLTRGLKGAKES